MSQISRTPSLFWQNLGESSSNVALMLTRAPRRIVVRFTGGCGLMSAEDAEGLLNLYAEAFDGFEGAALFGGTRMLRRADPTIVVPGITEVVPAIHKRSPKSVILGVIPRTAQTTLSPLGLIVSDEPGNDFVTYVHPDQDAALIVQASVDMKAIWDAEYLECLSIVTNLERFAGWSPLLIAYNGGGVTEKEVKAWAAQGYPVLLIRGSGRKTDELAANLEFRSTHPNVVVCEKDVESFREALVDLKVVQGRVAARIIPLNGDRKQVANG